jgi:hypothetical protein
MVVMLAGRFCSFVALPLQILERGMLWRKVDTVKVKFTLTMDDATVSGDHYDSIIIDWISDVPQDEVLRMSQKWITSRDFLTQRMVGLSKVGESSLTIEPVEESVK